MLEVGEYKNYKAICEIMGWKPVGGDTKVKHLKELESICKYTKDGYKFIVEEIYETPLPIVDNRKEYLKFESFKVDENKFNNKGVYIIRLNNEVYIGSTTYGFRKRFMQHKENWKANMDYTEDLIKRGGVYSILHDMTDVEDEDLIRMVEYEYIKYFRDSGFNVLNKGVPVSFDRYYKQKQNKQKYVKFKIEENDYDKVVEILKREGVKIY